MGSFPSCFSFFHNDPRTMHDNSTPTSSSEATGCISFGSDPTSTLVKADSSSTLSNLGSTPATTSSSSSSSSGSSARHPMSQQIPEHFYGPTQLDPAYLASLFPALAQPVASPSSAAAIAVPGPQHPPLTTGVEAVNLVATPSGPTSSSQPSLYTGIWGSSDIGSENFTWPHPSKRLRDKEAKGWSPCLEPSGSSEMCKEEHNSADLDKQEQQQQQTATKPTFYRKLDHLGMLEVPDIISCIFEFLDKPSLASVSRVNRMWRRYSMPLMWRHIVDRNWRHRTFCGLIASKANWVRSLHCQMSTDYDLLLSCNMAHLNSISMRGNHDSIDTKMAIIQKASNTLSSLSLSGVALTLSTDVAQVIQGLKRLSALKITRTSITGSFVHMLLDGCPDLEFLSLRGITLETTPHVDDEQPQLRKLDLDHPVSRILYLNLRNVDVDDDDLLYIVEACPELRELSIAGNSSLEDFSHVAKTLRKSCPHLYALDMASCVEITEDQFTVLWTMLGPQLKIVNLAGTKLGDKALALMARECQSLTRLDIQYCTNISTKGLHDFMCSVSPTLQQLEASGVTIDPEEIDDREWVCSGLEVLVIHINLFDRRQLCPGRQQENALEASSRTTTMTATANSTGTTSAVISPPPTTILEYGHAENITSIIGFLFGSRFARGDGHQSDRTALSRLDEDVIMESPPAEVDSMNDSVSNTPWRTPDPIDTSDSDTEMIHPEQAGPIEKERQPKGSSHAAAEEMHQVQSSAATGLEAVDAALKKKLRHPHHPIQRLTKLHYLGLMGTGTAKLVKSSVGEFIEAFGQVDHLDLSGLSQAFRQEDLTWLIESLPSLFQVDAEHYHISDDLRKWCRKEFPGILIHRKER